MVESGKERPLSSMNSCEVSGIDNVPSEGDGKRGGGGGSIVP